MSKIWFCKIGEYPGNIPPDAIMREHVSDAYWIATGIKPTFIFSGWNGELTEGERAVVEDREPVRSELKLFSFFADCGRMGDVHGLFIAKQSEVDAIIGEEIYFGEILGKHSDVSLKMKPEMFRVESDDEDKIAWLSELLGRSVSGYNPLDYYDPSNNEASEEDDE